MSRSKKKPIIKDSPRNKKKSALYWRQVRSSQKNALRSQEEIPDPKTIVNDYDYSDWTFGCWEKKCICIKKYGYKKCENK